MNHWKGFRQSFAAFFALACASFLVSGVFAQEQKKPSTGIAPPTTPAKQRQSGEALQRLSCATPPQCTTGNAVCTSRAVCYPSRTTSRPIEGCVAYACIMAAPRGGLDLMKRP